MQLVLNDKVRWQQRAVRQRLATHRFAGTVEPFLVEPIGLTEELADFTGPRHRGKLIDGGD